jgi:hypothetical protein
MMHLRFFEIFLVAEHSRSTENAFLNVGSTMRNQQ